MALESGKPGTGGREVEIHYPSSHHQAPTGRGAGSSRASSDTESSLLRLAAAGAFEKPGDQAPIEPHVEALRGGATRETRCLHPATGTGERHGQTLHTLLLSLKHPIGGVGRG